MLSHQVAACRPVLMRMAQQRLRNPAWAEDAVSETLLAALEKPHRYAGRAMLRTWLVGILRHKLVDQIRRHTRECQVESFNDEPEFGDLADAAPVGAFEAQAEWDDPQELLRRRQFIDSFHSCLKDLSAQQARAVMLRDWMEQDMGDICGQLGVTANNVSVILHRARRQLRTALQACGAVGGLGAGDQHAVGGRVFAASMHREGRP
jgi:RNA polymerase sigma-70 factor, ECF subfamily